MEIIGATANETWVKTLGYVMAHGQLIRPRGIPCFEVLGAHTVTPMNRPITTVAARKIGYHFMFAEAAWILGGQNDLASMLPYSKMIANFSDDGISFFGAYGPKIVDQLDYVVNVLHKDPHSRQAVINIWRENPPPTKDVPCTISAQFLIRDNQLHCIDTMRSSDIWLGWPYDTFNFSMLSSYIILKLQARNPNMSSLLLGNLYMNFGSLHLYDSNAVSAGKCLVGLNPALDFHYRSFRPMDEWAFPKQLISNLWDMANDGGGGAIDSEWCRHIIEEVILARGL